MAVLRNEGAGTRATPISTGRSSPTTSNGPVPEMNWIDYGLGGVLGRRLRAAAPATSADDLADVYAELSRARRLGGYEATERFIEIGTAESAHEADRLLRPISRPAAIHENGTTDGPSALHLARLLLRPAPPRPLRARQGALAAVATSRVRLRAEELLQPDPRPPADRRARSGSSARQLPGIAPLDLDAQLAYIESELGAFIAEFNPPREPTDEPLRVLPPKRPLSGRRCRSALRDDPAPPAAASARARRRFLDAGLGDGRPRQPRRRPRDRP